MNLQTIPRGGRVSGRRRILGTHPENVNLLHLIFTIRNKSKPLTNIDLGTKSKL